MPWSNQGGGNNGGPWGSSGGPNPWGNRGSGNNGPTPPDLEAMLRRGQDQFRRVMPKGFGGGRGILLILVLLLLFWASTGIYRVQPDELGVVQRFGAYNRVTQPGLHYHLPSPIETVQRPSVTQVRRIDIGFVSSDGRQGGSRDVPEESLMLTGDENIIDIDFTVLWRISDVRAYLFNIRTPEDTVKAVAESAMREVIGRTEIQPALTEARQQIESDTRELIQSVLDSYGAGIQITQVQLQNVGPPPPVVDAFNNVLRARQDQQRLRNEAESYRNSILPSARGDAERMIQEASGYREQVVAQAHGQAARFLSILQSYRQAPAVTAERLYLETTEEVLRNTTMLLIDPAADGSGVVPYLPLNELMRHQPRPAPASSPRTSPTAPSATQPAAPGGH